MPTIPSALVSTEWLAERLDAPDIRIVDASSYVPTANRDPLSEFEDEHIPGAVFFDIEEIADHTSGLPHMLPSPEKFASRVRRLGIGDGNRVIVYDSAGIMSAPRVWWMFRIFGKNDVAVLDGGLPKWKREGRPLSNDLVRLTERHFTARFNNMMVRDRSDIAANLASAREQVVDARSPGRFAGHDPEPRDGLRAGHIPGSFNVPYTSLVTAEGTLRSRPEITFAFERAGVDLRRPIVTTCGSGVTAAVLALALHELGVENVPVYDGSWCEWGKDASLPIDTGSR